jgi:hypothetical protein
MAPRLVSPCRDARQEEALKAMLAEGTPPSAPKLWAATLTDTEVDPEVFLSLLPLPYPLSSLSLFVCL